LRDEVEHNFESDVCKAQIFNYKKTSYRDLSITKS